MKTSLLVFTAVLTSSALAGPVVPNGVRFYFSPRAQTYFRENLETVLKKNDLDLSKNRWDDIRFILEDPMNESKLPGTFQEPQKEKLRNFQSRLKSYFYGFPIQTPRIQVALTGSDLPVRFRAMGAEVDPNGPLNYGRKRGIIILMHLEAENVNFSLKQLRLDDLANKDLFGVMGADEVKSSLLDGDRRAVKVEIPVLVNIGPKGATMEVLAVRTNLQKTIFDLNFNQLVLPTIKIVINGKEYSFDKVAFENEIRAMLPDLSDLLISSLKSYFERGGKDLIQPSFDELAETLNIDFSLPLPGMPETPDDLKIALRPTAAEYTKAKHLGVVFKAEIIDGKQLGSFPTLGQASEPSLTEVDAESYDLSLVLHPATLNGVIDRAWKRGLLSEIEIGKDSEGQPEMVRLPAPPVVNLSGLATSNTANFHARIHYSVKGLGRILFKGPIPIEMDLRVKLETNAKNEIEIVLVQIDETSLKIDTRATWLFPIRAKVERMVREKLAKVNRDIETKRTLMMSIPTLDEIIGIPLRLDSVKTDNGNLVLFCDFIGG